MYCGNDMSIVISTRYGVCNSFFTKFFFWSFPLICSPRYDERIRVSIMTNENDRPYVYLPAFLDTGLPRRNVNERDSGPMRGACHPYPISQPLKVGHTTGGIQSLLSSNSDVGSFTSTRRNNWKCCETGPTVFRPYPRRLESLTIYRCH